MTIIWSTLIAFAVTMSSSTSSANAASEHVMLSGYDPVSYFSDTGPERGNKSFSLKHDGHLFWFKDQANRDKFLAEPARYTPQFGGNCAFGMVFGTKSPVDPTIWKIVDGKLYLLLNAGTLRAWSKKHQSYIKRAETAWNVIK